MLELNDGDPRVSVQFDGRSLMLVEGDNLAAQLMAAGVTHFRNTPVSGAPRNPYCMMGACFDCLVEIGGVTRQACMCRVSEGLVISVPKGGVSSGA